MKKFTPGPWKILPEEADKDYIRIRGTALGRRYKVANVLTPIYEGAHTREAEETRANANLMAAAPAMYEALSEMVAMFIDTKRYPDPETVTTGLRILLPKMQAALRAADGGE